MLWGRLHVAWFDKMLRYINIGSYRISNDLIEEVDTIILSGNA